jgi:hypothetical protein
MLRFVESFDHYGNGNILQKWTSKGATGNSLVTGRNGKGCLIADGGGLYKTLDQQGEWIVGWALNLQSQASGAQSVILGFLNVSIQIATVRFNPDSTLSLYANNTVIGTSTASLNPLTWYYLECKIITSGVANVSVTMTLKLNGQVVASGSGSTGIDLTNWISPTGTTNVVNFGSSGALGGLIVDDIYIMDAQGSHNNNFSGDLKVLAVFPDADISVQWVPHGIAGGNYKCVNENPPDDDVTYVSSNNVGDKDQYHWQQIPSNFGQIIGVHYNTYARKDNEGLRTLRQITGTALSDAAAPVRYLGDSYVYYSLPYDVDPATNAAWSIAGFNGTHFGIILDS